MVLLGARDGVKPGSHTAQDIEYAFKSGKRVMALQDLEKLVGQCLLVDLLDPFFFFLDASAG